MAILKKGLSGEPVKRLQSKLGVEADAVFGSATEKALKDWQTKNGLAADGVAGPDTFMAMGLYELVLLKEGTRGEAVKKLQEKLGVGADGQFGSGTGKALRDYQAKNGLVADGMAGPATLVQMKLFKEITADTVKSSQIPASAVPEPPANPAASTQKPVVSAEIGGMRSIWDTIKSAFK
jgi:peptidoglycan hydrolase-like protein with peptidoglycan-binding domain